MQQPPKAIRAEAGWRKAWAAYLGELRAFVADQQFVRLALVAILILGASLRLTGVNWDDQTHLHPDERFLTGVETKLEWPKSIAEYFDEARSPLNPYNRGESFFVYGTAPIFVVKALGILLNQNTYWEIHLVGRVVSALYDLAVVLLVYLIGRRLYDRWIGLLGAFLMACTVLNIQHAHFFVVEPFITLMVTLAFFFTIRAVQDGGWWNWALMGACFGMAVAGKISVATYVVVIAAASILRALREPAVAEAASAGPRVVWRRTLGRLSLSLQVEDGEAEPAQVRALQRGLSRAALGVALALFAALVAFRVTQPYAFAGASPFSLRLSERWLENMSIASRTVSGAIDMPPGHQWTDRAPIWFAWRNMVLWGMGLPLGLAAWSGWLVALVELVRRRKLDHLLLLLWVTFVFLHQSTQYVKVVRYFLPIYPLLVLLGAYFVAWLLRQARGTVGGAAQQASAWGRRLRRAALAGAGCVGVIVALGTLLYAEAFTNIYRRPLSRVTASRWVYENIPPGSTLTYETWDDIVPQNVDNKDAGQYYSFVKTEPYWEDCPEKRDALFSWLDQADYIVFSSNRLYDSIPRLPERYPLTTAYYRYLFSGELGFEVVKVITSYPNLGPIQFVDDTADEAFTVYDHPKVTILKKTPAYSSVRTRQLLGDIDVERLVRMSPLQTMRSHHGLMLSASERQAQEQGGTWSAIFSRGSLANRFPVIAWLVVLELLAVAAAPLAFVAFPRFRDRGFIFAKTLGVLLVSYLAWLGPSLHLVPYTRATIGGVVLLLLALAACLAWRRRREVRQFLRQEWRFLLFEEALYLAAFGAFLLVRLGNPDLWHPAMGGEKPMDLAYLNAIVKSTWFPPYDPWFAGGYINYYYFGHVVVATLCKLSTIVPSTAYNLALPTLFALTAMGGYAVVSGLLEPEGAAGSRRVLDRPVRFGLLGALTIAVLGNLGQVRLLLNGLWQASQLEFRSTIPGLAGLVRGIAGLFQVLIAGRPLNFRPEWWYWNASRVMGAGEINEFPFFTFLYADLHAHLIALPFALLALGLTVSLLRGGWPTRPSPPTTPRTPHPPSFLPSPQGHFARRQAEDWPAGLADGRLSKRLGAWAARVDWGEWLTLGLLALTLGELRVNNTWDYPTYLLVALAGLLFGRLLRPEGAAWHEAWPIAGRFLFLVLASTLLFQPFHARYGAAYTSVELWRGPRTTPGDYLVIHGLFLFILVSYLLSRAFGYQARGALARAVRLSLGRPLCLGRYNHLAGLLVVPGTGFQVGWLGIVALLLAAAAAIVAGWWLLGLGLPLLAVGLWLALRRDLPPAERFAALLFSGGLLLTVTVEAVVLRGDIGRMNTVFKFYLQVWVLWGVAAVVGLASLAHRWHRWPDGRRTLWQGTLGLLLFGAALYPLTATYGKINDRFDRAVGPTLDGTAYARTATYPDQGAMLSLQSDMEAIRWLQENVEGSPVILEGNTPLYRWGSRVSIYTGLPTVVGWDWHQKQQRAIVSGDVVEWRLADVRSMYNDTNESELVKLLRLYDVSYVYVGELERAYYSPEGLAKFDRLTGRLFDVVYRRAPVTIYKVRKESLGGLSAHPFLLPQAGGGDKSLLLGEPVDRLPLVDDRGWNHLANAGPLPATLAWWLALSLLGWAAWPLCLGLCRGLPDRGYLLAKALGWLIVGYGVWLGASSRLIANRVPHISAAAGLLLLAGLWAAYRQRRRLYAFWRARRRLLLCEEALFSGAFLAFVVVRLLNPDLWQPWFGGEKMMESAYLNAILKSAHFPPYDPYFAGGYINYYYYGLYLVNVLVKLTGIVPEVAFNLAVPTFFALTVGQAFSLGHALTWRLRGRRWLWGGIVAAVGVAGLANLTVLAQWLAGLVALGGGTPQPESGLEALRPLLLGLARWPLARGGLSFDYWYGATRIIPHTINEFPFFSFLFADLHPHMMSLPFTIAALVLCLAFVVGCKRVEGEAPAEPPRALRQSEGSAGECGPGAGERAPVRRDARQDVRRWLGGSLALRRPLATADKAQRTMDRGPRASRWAFLLLALTVGALGPLNTWDLPTYAGLAVLVLGWRALSQSRGWRGLAWPGLVAALACLLYWPFYAHYRAPAAALAFLPNHTRLRYFLVIWGLWLVALYGWLGGRWWRGKDGAGRLARDLRGRPSRRVGCILRGVWGRAPASTRLRWLLGVAALTLSLAAVVAGEAVVALLLPLVAWGLDLWLRPLARDEERLAGLLAAAGGLILAGSELVYLADFLQGSDWQRMNTFFKFGIQAWVLLALATAAGLPEMLAWLRRPGGKARRLAWTATMISLATISLAYIPLGVAARVAERFPGGPPLTGTLDGLAYMQNGVYYWPDKDHPVVLRYDYEAIRWLLEHVRGTPVIAEAPLGYYREGGMRVSSYTGLPTLLGAHQLEQRPAEVVSERGRLAEELYRSADAATTLALMRRLRVQYVYFGQLEENVYGPAARIKFDDLASRGELEVIYANPKVMIYRFQVE